MTKNKESMAGIGTTDTHKISFVALQTVSGLLGAVGRAAVSRVVLGLKRERDHVTILLHKMAENNVPVDRMSCPPVR